MGSGDSLEDPLPRVHFRRFSRYDPVYHKRTWRVRGDSHAYWKYSRQDETLPLAVYSEVAGGNMDRAAVYVAVIPSHCFPVCVVMNMMAKTGRTSKYKCRIQKLQKRSTKMEGTIRPSIRLTLEKEERFFGPGSSRPSGAGGGKRFYPGRAARWNVLFQELEDH